MTDCLYAMLLWTILFHLCVVLLAHGSSVQIQPIALDTVQTGVLSTAINVAKPLFTGFSKKDPSQQIGLAEQRIFQFQITYAAAPSHVVISTCNGSQFDTYLALFDELPTSTGATPIAESANDITCGEDTNRATLSVTLLPSIYYFILTGNEDAHGAYQVSLFATITNESLDTTPWHLDRIDQRNLPLDNLYTVTSNLNTITVYLLYTGVSSNHEQLRGRIQPGYDFVRNSNDTNFDCTGQGTHAASLICGQHYGGAQNVVIIPLRVFDCDNSATIANIVDAIYWVLVHSQRNNLQTKSIVSLMFSLSASQAGGIAPAMKQLLRQGIPVVVPAGDDASDACNYFPASESSVITIGAVDITDTRPEFSNYGTCVDIYAPGVDLTSAWHTAENATFSLSGTSQAAAVATAVVAQLLSLNPGISSSVAKSIISSVGTPSVVKNVAKNETNSLLYVRSVPNITSSPPPSRFVDVYSRIRAKVLSCAAGGQEISSLRRFLAKNALVAEQDVEVECRIGEYKNIERQIGESRILQLTIRVAERDASGTFSILEKALSEDKAGTEHDLDFSFDVVEMPWAVDSHGVVYWGAPSFPPMKKWSVHAGVIAAGVFIIIFVASGIGVGIWICQRRIRKLDDIESMEGSADFDRGPARFNDFGNDDASLRSSRSFRSLKRGLSFRRMDTHSENATQTQERGMNRMSSFLCAGPFRIAKDLVRLQSFGGEAFAGMTPLERSESMKARSGSSAQEGGGGNQEDGKGGRDQRNKSFRAKGNTGLWRLNTNIGQMQGKKSENQGEEFVAEMRLNSIAGEAFAMLEHMPSSPNSTSQNSSPTSDNGGSKKDKNVEVKDESS